MYTWKGKPNLINWRWALLARVVVMTIGEGCSSESADSNGRRGSQKNKPGAN